MCGIAAIVSKQRAIPPEAIGAMVRRLSHRGPDGNGALRLDGCHLGHTRLSVIDLAGGAQPMSDAQERCSIVFNGEIYNFPELRRDLENFGHHFETRSDTEVLLAAYLAYGEQMLPRIHGQFAFAVWDRTERKLFAARDRLGEKPLFWSLSNDGHLVLASEIKAILASGLIDPEIDPISVDLFLALIYIPPERSIYANIKPLPPGRALNWENGRMRQWTYWKPRISTIHRIEEQEAVQHTRHLLERAVHRQMVADVSVGAFLSGGLDSSTVVALMTRHTTEPVRTFAVGFGDLINELPFARSVAERYHTRHSEMQMTIPVGELLERMVDVYDEPFADSSNIPTYLVSEFARRHVKVALSGDGGDELFGGYGWYDHLKLQETLPASAGSLAWARAWNFGCRRLHRLGLPIEERAARARLRCGLIGLKRSLPDVWQRHVANVTYRWSSRRRDRYRTVLPLLETTYQPPADVTGIDRAVDFDVRCYLPGDILVKVDRAAMAHGLEVRAPFLDVELVEFVLSLPARLRFRGNRLKHLLRQACADLWPPSIRDRSKQGFGAPLAAWLQRPDVQALAVRTLRSGTALSGLLPYACERWNRLDVPQQRWNLLVLGLWLEKHSACLNRLSLAS
jgi:asparagine synthase (glutamine-hydrolysing)